MTALHVLRVFCGPDGGGNPLGVFLDGVAIAPERRLAVAADLGFSETVFVDAIEAGEPDGGTAARIAIFTPGTELPFAGHPTVGTSWLLAASGSPVTVLRPPAGDVATWPEGELTWIRARARWVHAITVVELASPAAVDALSGPPPGEGSYYPWAWVDEAAGILRSRYFAGFAGIVEDEATGAAAVVMGDLLRRPVTIRQGVGSELHVRPGPDGTVVVGGRVEPVEERAYPG
jgi:predicted PhzF superfamily epimerase YddE/YHI9